jgi:hypothetical protein
VDDKQETMDDRPSGQGDSEPADDAPETFGRYQLLERIGAGGMAEVFKARIDAAAGTEKFVCIKRILPELSRSSDFTSLFVSEARITLPLTHSNITQVFDFGEVDETYYLAMEYVKGQNLGRVLDQLRSSSALLELPAALFVAAELCRGLEYAHGLTDSAGKPAPVVHRDVTPQNVLISYHGEVKLTDFGIALAATKAPKGGQVLRGKPCYVAPEQASGSSGDPRSDIFSVGAVLYEMLTGVRPFEGENDAETLDRIKTHDVPPPSTHNSEIDAELDRVVLKALSRDPAQRYPRAGDLRAELSQMLHERATAFTAVELAKLMRELFAWEIESERGSGGPRDRLLFQLSRAGVQVGGKEATTDELLQMGTVAIGVGDSTSSTAVQDRRSWAWIAGGGVLLLALLTGALFALRPGGSRPTPVDAMPPRQVSPAPHQLTEHLLPGSLRMAEAASPVAALPPASQPTQQATTPPATGARAKSRRRPRSTPALKAADEQAVARLGHVNCNSWPWSVVYLNGKQLRGNTPLYGVEVGAGKHQLRFVNPELGLSREVSVTIRPGETKTIAVKLQPSGTSQHAAQSNQDDTTD